MIAEDRLSTCAKASSFPVQDPDYSYETVL
jgi:hypothetical protein